MCVFLFIQHRRKKCQIQRALCQSATSILSRAAHNEVENYWHAVCVILSQTLGILYHFLLILHSFKPKDINIKLCFYSISKDDFVCYFCKYYNMAFCWCSHVVFCVLLSGRVSFEQPLLTACNYGGGF